MARLLLVALIFGAPMRAQIPTTEQKREYLLALLTKKLPTYGASLDCLVPDGKREEFLAEINKVVVQNPSLFNEEELFDHHVQFEGLLKGMMMAKGWMTQDKTEHENYKRQLALEIRPKLMALSSDMSCLVNDKERNTFISDMNRWAGSNDVVPVDVFGQRMSVDAFIRETIDAMDAEHLGKSLSPAAAAEPTAGQKREYLKSMLNTKLPTSDAALDCLVLEGKRDSFVDELNGRIGKTPPVFTKADLFNHQVTFDGLVKGTLLAMGKQTSDKAQFDADYANVAHALMPNLVESESKMDCLVGPTMREKFISDMNNWTRSQDTISADIFSKMPAVTLDGFVRKIAEDMGPAVDEAAKQAADAEQAAIAAAAAPSESYKAVLSRTTAAPTAKWHWWQYLLIILGLCFICPCIGIACSAALCYESVAWIFGGGDKPQKKNTSRGVKVKVKRDTAPVAPAAAPVVVPATVATTSVQYLSVAAPMVQHAPVASSVASPAQYMHVPVAQTYARPTPYVASSIQYA
eukprot:TRINITY_DN25610_c0_g2_i1.p1 TRINITY_DN25610_c0_g2~~TRINITY_DN25610_c0_g2_i1.p1  ORF type:complete len:540 (+),score=87.57 TRINITY_DN25610_c0_g2_i1:61-1620(+)